jgi:hypothetical protein
MRNPYYRQTQRARALCDSLYFNDGHRREPAPTGSQQPKFPTQNHNKTRNRNHISTHDANR